MDEAWVELPPRDPDGFGLQLDAETRAAAEGGEALPPLAGA